MKANSIDDSRFVRAIRCDKFAPIILGGLAFLASLLRHRYAWIEPFGSGQEDEFPSRYVLQFIKNWEYWGFGAMRGAPIAFELPTWNPGEFKYVNHPPTIFWVAWFSTRAFGFEAWVLRLFPVVTTALCGGLWTWHFAAIERRLVAISFALAWFATPMTTIFGAMVNYESPVLFFMSAAWIAAARSRSARGLSIVAIVATVLAVFCDWAGAFVGGSIIVAEFLRDRSDRRWLRPATSCFGAVAALIPTFLLIVWWQGGVREAVDAMRTAGQIANQFSGESRHDWWLAQGRFLERGYGITIGVAAALGLVVASFRPRDGVAAAIIGMLVPGVLNIVAFRARAFNHEFWWYYASVSVCAAAAFLIEALASSLARRIKVIPATPIAAAVFLVIILLTRNQTLEMRAQRGPTRDLDRIQQFLSERMTKRDIFVSSFAVPPHGRFLDGWYWDINLREARMVDIATWWKSESVDADRLMVFIGRFEAAERPTLLDEMRAIGKVESVGADWLVTLTR